MTREDGGSPIQNTTDGCGGEIGRNVKGLLVVSRSSRQLEFMAHQGVRGVGFGLGWVESP